MKRPPSHSRTPRESEKESSGCEVRGCQAAPSDHVEVPRYDPASTSAPTPKSQPEAWPEPSVTRGYQR